MRFASPESHMPALDHYVGCPHCGAPVDVRAQIALARRSVADAALALLFNGASGEEITHPLEKVVNACLRIEDDASTRAGPLAHLRLRPDP
jgi:hypothetical protein